MRSLPHIAARAKRATSHKTVTAKIKGTIFAINSISHFKEKCNTFLKKIEKIFWFVKLSNYIIFAAGQFPVDIIKQGLNLAAQILCQTIGAIKIAHH